MKRRSGVLSFLVGKRVIVLHALIYQSQETPDRESEPARKRMEETPKLADLKLEPVPSDHKVKASGVSATSAEIPLSLEVPWCACAKPRPAI